MWQGQQGPAGLSCGGRAIHSSACGHGRLLKAVLLGGKRVLEMRTERKHGVG